MSDNNRAGTAVPFFLAGAVLGGAIGATVALLFAPQSGEETRKMIKKKAEKAGKDLVKMKEEWEPRLMDAKDSLTAGKPGSKSK